MLAFIHLSDIHFNKSSGDPYDIDQDLRDELLYDISRCYDNIIRKIDGILICGDIAFSGKKEEYSIATSFLDEIFKKVPLEKDRVFCVPGNHDVDRSIAKSGMSVRCLHHALKSAATVTNFDSCLGRIFRNKMDAEALYSPIACYNEEFAAKYSCKSTQDRPNWEQDIMLHGNYTLRLIGINSTIVSSEEDSLPGGREEPMRISRMQIPSRKENAIYLSLCHHPPECWFDPENILKQRMNHRVALQLYGHKHLQTIKREGNSLIVGCGAANPVREDADWVPRYNWITLDVSENKGVPALIVKIYPRILDKDEDRFEADRMSCEGQEFIEFLIDLVDQDAELARLEKTQQEKESKVFVDSWERRFAYDFMNLPYYKREVILQKLNLKYPEDDGMKHTELLKIIIHRAEAKECVDELLAEITRAKGQCEL